MKEFLNNLTSLSWWLSVMVVGIAASLLASYFRNWIDAALSRVSTQWKSKSEKKAKERQELFERIRDDIVNLPGLVPTIIRGFRVTG
jgi:hypothetical protein